MDQRTFLTSAAAFPLVQAVFTDGDPDVVTKTFLFAAFFLCSKAVQENELFRKISRKGVEFIEKGAKDKQYLAMFAVNIAVGAMFASFFVMFPRVLRASLEWAGRPRATPDQQEI